MFVGLIRLGYAAHLETSLSQAARGENHLAADELLKLLPRLAKENKWNPDFGENGGYLPKIVGLFDPMCREHHLSGRNYGSANVIKQFLRAPLLSRLLSAPLLKV